MEYEDVSGIAGVEWDAVEVPSQFLENFCYDLDTMSSISSHVHTGERVPVEIAQKLRDARVFMSGTATRRQVYFASLDMALHEGPIADSIALQRVREK